MADPILTVRVEFELGFFVVDAADARLLRLVIRMFYLMLTSARMTTKSTRTTMTTTTTITTTTTTTTTTPTTTKMTKRQQSNKTTRQQNKMKTKEPTWRKARPCGGEGARQNWKEVGRMTGRAERKPVSYY